MTQLDRLKLIFAAIAADVKAILTKQGDITQLTTTNKTNFVSAINEVKSNVSAIPAAIAIEYWSVVTGKIVGPATAVTIGGQIPGASSGTTYGAGQFILHVGTGDIYIVETGGTVALHSAMPDNTERTVVITSGGGGGASINPSLRIYKKVNGELSGLPFTNMNSSSVWHIDPTTLIGTTLNVVLGDLTNLLTNTKASFIDSINEAKYPFKATDTVTADFTNSTLNWGAVVTIGDPIPGTINKTFQIGTVGVSLSTGGTMGNVYTLQAGGVWSLTNEMTANGYRVINLSGTATSGDYNQHTGRVIVRREGSSRELVYGIAGTDLIRLNATTNGFVTPSTAIGQLSDLTTTSKVLVGAINEVKASITGGGGISTDVWNVVNARTVTPTTAVTIGGQVPGATTGINYTVGDYRLDVTTGDIYIVQAGGTVALHSAMPDNTERTVNVLYGTGATTSAGAGLRVYKKLSNVLTSISVPALTSSNIIHVASGGSVGLNLQSVLGDLSTLSTTNKTNFVTVINEVITNKGIGTNTDTTTTTGFTNPTLQFTTQRYGITANASGAVRYGAIRKYEYLSNFNNTTGKNAAALDWYSHLGSGTVGRALAHEARLSTASGATITEMTGYEAVLSENLSDINTLYLNRSTIETNGGTINNVKGYAVDKVEGAGSLTNLVGFEFGDLSALSSTNRKSFSNLDPGAPVVSAAPVIDQSIVIYSPSANNFDVAISSDIQFVRLTPVDVYNNLNISFAPLIELINGQMVHITISKEVRKVTWIPGSGVTVVNAPNSLDAGQTVTFKFHAAQVEWVCMTVSGTGSDNLNKPPVLNQLLIYYGFPISYKGIYTTAGVIADIASKYKYWVVGDTYGDPLHESYADTATIVAGVRALGVIVYGYVPIGLNTSALTIAQIRTKIDQWSNLGVDGIFLDEFGFDYANTRTRQIDCVNYVHGKNLPYCANAWTVEDFCYDNINQVPWGSGDWRYTNFATYNPTNLVLPRNPTDSYLFENFGFSNTGISIIWDAQERSINVKNLSITRNFKVWVEAVFGETVPGTLDLTKLGDFTSLEEAGAYISANAYIYDFDVVGGGGFSFGSNGTPIEMPLFALPADAVAATTPQSTNFTTMEAIRYFGDVTVKVINSATDQKVIISSVAAKVLQGTYPNSVVDEITVSTTAPLTPKLNQLWLDIS